jgi:hypothetical protein
LYEACHAGDEIDRINRRRIAVASK